MDLVGQEDVNFELIVVNDVRGVIFVITLDDEVVKTSLSSERHGDKVQRR